jgi:ABC-type multidrug transport system fused ATPase/permease subunit
LPKNWKQIKIENLSFSHRDLYDESHAPQSLHDISIKIERGKKIAFIGESGSGKNTLLALFRGLYEPETSPKFEVDGKTYQIAILNEAVTIFPQEPEVFENTIRYNITLGLQFREANVWKVCEEAYFAQTAKKLPNGLESSIQEKGLNLSGG